MTVAQTKPRLLIFVIAYCAEGTLRKVLERIPLAVLDAYDCEILVVDDASQDRTFAIGREYQALHPEIRMTVLRNQCNQGYGGNQKVGYTYAITEKFDFVAMLHGDGQYAPEELPRLLEPLNQGSADAVMGSRMMTRLGALRGGMPFYKFIGNRILSTVQNRVLGTRLTEFHSGYRIYAVRALERIPFRLNSNDFHFDTQIILQLLVCGARIVELPIPTYYGDEICRVNGVAYAKNVMLSTLGYAAHRMGVLYQRRYDPAPDDNIRYQLKLGFPSSHTFALDSIPDGARVIDIGSGPGDLARELLKKNCVVALVDRQAPSTPLDNSTKVMLQDLDEPLSFEVADYDYILLLDIVEHLRRPEVFLERLRQQFDFTPKKLILSTPNIAFIVQRLMLLAGQFNYGKAGILDVTHTRLYSFASMTRLLEDAGFRIQSVRGVPAPFPRVLGNGRLGRLAVAVNQGLIRLSKGLFSYQVFIEATSTPSVDFILRDTKQRSTGHVVAAKRVKAKRAAPRRRAPDAKKP